MKRILHISKFYHPYYGGIEDVVYTIVNELRHDYEQRVICFNHESGTVRTIDNGIEILRINTPLTIASQPVSFSYLRHLKNEIKTFRPDFIHLHLPNPLVCLYLEMLNLSNTRLIVHWHADILGKQMLYSLCKPIEKHILQKAECIITTSRQYIEKSIPLQPFKDKIRILPNTINEQKLKLYAGEEKEVEKIKRKYNNKNIVLFIGRHVPYKGIDYLIRATKYLTDDAIVLIGGTGMQTQYLKHLAAPMGNKIHFIGRLPNEEMKYYLYASTVFAFPSIDRREAFGVALAEALYCGTPAVSFKLEGSGTTWVNQNNQTGIVVDRLDERAYAQAINSMLNDQDTRQLYSENAREWVNQHFMKNQIQMLKQVYG